MRVNGEMGYGIKFEREFLGFMYEVLWMWVCVDENMEGGFLGDDLEVIWEMGFNGGY